MARPAYQVNQLNRQVQIATPEGKPPPEFIQQWNLLLALVSQVTTNTTGIAALDAVTVDTTAPISGGGPILALTPITHDASGVTPGTYGDATHAAQVTVDTEGHVTAASEVLIAGAQWTLFDTITPTVSADIDVTGLDGVADVLILFEAVTKNTNANTLVRFSVDGGSTFFNTAGDYRDFAYNTNNAVAAASDAFYMQLTANTTALYLAGLLQGLNVDGAPKTFAGELRSGIFIGSHSPVNAIRITTGGLQQFNAGTIYILTR